MCHQDSRMAECPAVVRCTSYKSIEDAIEVMTTLKPDPTPRKMINRSLRFAGESR